MNITTNDDSYVDLNITLVDSYDIEIKEYKK